MALDEQDPRESHPEKDGVVSLPPPLLPLERSSRESSPEAAGERRGEEPEEEQESSLLGMYPEPKEAPAGSPAYPRIRTALGFPSLRGLSPRETATVLAARTLGAVSLGNVLIIFALLFARLLLGSQPCASPAPPAAAGAAAGGGQPPRPVRDFRQNKAYVEQMQTVAQRNIFRRSVRISRRLHANNDVLLPTAPCPQKVRLGGPKPYTYFWLCIPQHQLRLHWPVAYAVGRPEDFTYESNLYHRFSINSTIYDPSFTPGSHRSLSLPFITEIGGAGAEPLLAKSLADTSTSLRLSFSAGTSFYGGASVLRISCHGCDVLFAVPVFRQPSLSASGSYPPVGQIVLNLDRWAAPFDTSTREVIQTLEGAGYLMFHSDQIFDSYQNQSFTASFIHQSLLFPQLLRASHMWQLFEEQAPAASTP